MNPPAFVLAAAAPARAVLTACPFVSGRLPILARPAARLPVRRPLVRLVAEPAAEAASREPRSEAGEEPVSVTDAAEEPVPEALEEPVAEAVEELVSEVVEEPVANTAEELVEEPVSEVVEEPAASTAEELVEEPVAEAVEEEVAEAVEEPFVEAAEELADEAVGESLAAAAQGPAKEEPAAPVETADEEPAGEERADGVEAASDKAFTPIADKRKRRRTRPKREVTLPLENITVGMELEGTVKSVTDYGAFVGDMGTPTDGLLHVSQLMAGFVKNVTDVVNVGDKIKVRVLGVDMAKGNFSLTLKTAEELAAGQSRGQQGGGGEGAGEKKLSYKESRREEQNKRWTEFKFDSKEFIDAKVTSITDFGGFCQMVDEHGDPLSSAPTEGLIHISELSEERVSSVSDVLEVGQMIKVRVVSADRKRNRISMSLKPYAESSQEGTKDLAKDRAGAESSQPKFKTTFELAFERAKPPSKE